MVEAFVEGLGRVTGIVILVTVVISEFLIRFGMFLCRFPDCRSIAGSDDHGATTLTVGIWTNTRCHNSGQLPCKSCMQIRLLLFQMRPCTCIGPFFLFLFFLSRALCFFLFLSLSYPPSSISVSRNLRVRSYFVGSRLFFPFLGGVFGGSCSTLAF